MIGVLSKRRIYDGVYHHILPQHSINGIMHGLGPLCLRAPPPRDKQ